MSRFFYSVLNEIQPLVLEVPDNGIIWASGLWTREETLGYLEEVQNDFLGRTGMVQAWFDVPIVPLSPRQVYPPERLHTLGMSLTMQGRTTPLHPLDPLERIGLSPGSDRPYGYTDEELETQGFSLTPLPSLPGVVHIRATVVGEVWPVRPPLFVPPLGDGPLLPAVFLTVPDEFTPYLLYGVLARMFGKPGRAFDAARRDYAQGRYEEGVQLGQSLVDAVVMA